MVYILTSDYQQRMMKRNSIYPLIKVEGEEHPEIFIKLYEILIKNREADFQKSIEKFEKLDPQPKRPKPTGGWFKYKESPLLEFLELDNLWRARLYKHESDFYEKNPIPELLDFLLSKGYKIPQSVIVLT